MLRGEELPEDIDEVSGFELAAADGRPREVVYNPTIPIETFDFIVTDECHRSIYNLWRQVLEYFDAFLIGLTATPSKQTIGFFDQNLVTEYNHERAVADGVNVGYDVYRIRTKVTGQGATVEQGFYVDKRHKETRVRRWEQLDEDLTYAASDVDRSVVVPSQIRTVLEVFKEALFTGLFPGRTLVPETLIQEFRTSPQLRIAVTAKEKASSLIGSFRAYIEQPRAEITAPQILYSRPYRQRLTEPMLKELERKLRDSNATLNEDLLWKAFATAAPDQVRGRSAVNRFADLVPLVRFALEQQPVLEPFAESVGVRFQRWLEQKAAAGTAFTDDQRAWLELIRDHIATSLSIEPDDFGFSPFLQRGGLGRAAQLFGADLTKLLDELNGVLAA